MTRKLDILVIEVQAYVDALEAEPEGVPSLRRAERYRSLVQTYGEYDVDRWIRIERSRRAKKRAAGIAAGHGVPGDMEQTDETDETDETA